MLTHPASETLHVFGAILLGFTTIVFVAEGLCRILGKRGPLDLDLLGAAIMLVAALVGLVAFVL